LLYAFTTPKSFELKEKRALKKAKKEQQHQQQQQQKREKKTSRGWMERHQLSVVI
jgi:hypothetical protein